MNVDVRCRGLLDQRRQRRDADAAADGGNPLGGLGQGEAAAERTEQVTPPALEQIFGHQPRSVAEHFVGDLKPLRSAVMR